MALTIETGVGIATADSYISITDANSYFTDRGSPSDWSGLNDAGKESALRYATAYLDGIYKFVGEVTTTSQSLAWPREGAFDEEGRNLEANVIPQRVKDATCELALLHTTTPLNKSYARGGAIERQKVGPIETSYFSSARSDTWLPIVGQIIRGLATPRTGVSFDIERN